MIRGSLPLPFPLFRPADFSRAFYFRVFRTMWEPGTGYKVAEFCRRLYGGGGGGRGVGDKFVPPPYKRL